MPRECTTIDAAGPGVRASEMSDGTKQDELARKARKHFLADERARDIEQRVENEKRRHGEMVAKTARLREQRLAKEAAERGVASKAEPSKRGRK
jgi:hypothetical protein